VNCGVTATTAYVTAEQKVTTDAYWKSGSSWDRSAETTSRI
jgi:hypothetical protein